MRLCDVLWLNMNYKLQILRRNIFLIGHAQDLFGIVQHRTCQLSPIRIPLGTTALFCFSTLLGTAVPFLN
jgi:hypothetical protein